MLDYVGRYTHRVAISNNRLLDIEDDQVSFQWKDYRDPDRQKTMTLSAEEFIRRFLIHVLPDGFQRIRYYGFLSNRHREGKLVLCRQLLGMPVVDPETAPGDQPSDYDFDELYEKLTGSSLRQCPTPTRLTENPIALPTRTQTNLSVSNFGPRFNTRLQFNDQDPHILLAV